MILLSLWSVHTFQAIKASKMVDKRKLKRVKALYAFFIILDSPSKFGKDYYLFVQVSQLLRCNTKVLAFPFCRAKIRVEVQD